MTLYASRDKGSTLVAFWECAAQENVNGKHKIGAKAIFLGYLAFHDFTNPPAEGELIKDVRLTIVRRDSE